MTPSDESFGDPPFGDPPFEDQSFDDPFDGQPFHDEPYKDEAAIPGEADSLGLGRDEAGDDAGTIERAIAPDGEFHGLDHDDSFDALPSLPLPDEVAIVGPDLEAFEADLLAAIPDHSVPGVSVAVDTDRDVLKGLSSTLWRRLHPGEEPPDPYDALVEVVGASADHDERLAAQVALDVLHLLDLLDDTTTHPGGTSE